MKPKLLIVYLLIVLVPLAAVAWLGAALARQEQQMVAVRFREILLSRLHDVDQRITDLLDERERLVMAGPPLSSLSPDALRERAAASGIVRQYFVLDASGDLVYPSPAGPLTESEQRFLRRTESIWANGEIPGPVAEASAPTTQWANTLGASKGWHAGYLESGIRLLFWWRETNGNIVGAEFNEVRLLADIVGLLPNADVEVQEADSTAPEGRVELVDSRGDTIYYWYAPFEGPANPVRLALSPPLNAWTLRYVPMAAIGADTYGRGFAFNIVSGIVALGLTLIALAFYFYRAHTHAMREALQRVTFVNQVSHELKTPLTNIRMYAEVLDEELSDGDEAVRKRIQVIVSESQRLSRLIGNVLTFGREQRQTLRLHRAPRAVDEALREAIAQHEEPLKARGIAVTFEAGAPGLADLDRDALQQIVGNLLSNAEKYAGKGTTVRVSSQRNGEFVAIIVADDGPGIRASDRQRVFEAFCRADDRLTEGVSGVGLGLTIARQMARLHGGDVTLEPSEKGARFRVVLHAPACTGGKTE